MTCSRYAGNGTRRRKLRARLLASQDACAICLLPVDKSLRTPHPLSAEVDEIVPVSKGGDCLDFGNCQLAHRCCNQWRGNKSMDEVAAIRGAAREMFGSWRSPLEFASKARMAHKAMKHRKSREKAAERVSCSRRW